MSTKLPYWAEAYIEHMQQFRPSTYAALLESGELDETALAIQAVASAYYQRRKDYYKSLGDSDTQADVLAEGDTKREYILLPSDEDDIEDDLFDEPFDDDDLDDDIDDDPP